MTLSGGTGSVARTILLAIGASLFTACLWSQEGAVVARSGATPDQAVVLREGAVANRQVVAIGRDLKVAGRALRNAAVLQGDARVSGEIVGDLVVLGGSVLLSPTAVVRGDVYALGGQVTVDPGAEIGGRSVAYPEAPATLLVLIEGPALGLSAGSPQVLAVKSSLLLIWLVVAFALLALWRRPLQRTREEIVRRPLAAFWFGLVSCATGLLLILFLIGLTPPVVGVPLVVLVVMAALALKVWGTVAIFDAVGWALDRLRRRHGGVRGLDPTLQILIGCLLLGSIKFVPVAGSAIWSAITLVGIGAALASRFGRPEPIWVP